MEIDKIGEYFKIIAVEAYPFVKKIALAALILWVGFKIIKKVIKFIDLALVKASVSETLRPFLRSTFSFVLKGALLFGVASIIGADLTGLLAILAAAGFAIGMALQGSLGNFASGILILTLKPYKIGDWIQLEDKFGQVQEIGIFSTDVLTPGNKILIIPNSMITETVVTNFSERGKIRLELEVTMPYDESFPKVKQIIIDALLELPQVVKDPLPDVGIQNFDSHSVQLLVRPYVEPDQYWSVVFESNRAIKKAFSENNIKVAYSEGVEMGSIGE